MVCLEKESFCHRHGIFLDVWTASGKADFSTKLPGKAYSIDCVKDGNRIVVATSGRKNVLIDVRFTRDNDLTAEVMLVRESSLKYQTRVARFFTDGTGMAVGSIEGRVAIEFFDELGIKPSGKLLCLN